MQVNDQTERLKEYTLEMIEESIRKIIEERDKAMEIVEEEKIKREYLESFLKSIIQEHIPKKKKSKVEELLPLVKEGGGLVGYEKVEKTEERSFIGLYSDLLLRPPKSDEKKMPVYVDEKGRLIYEFEKMPIGKFYEVEWQGSQLLVRKEKDEGIAFYEILDDETISKIKEKLK